MSTYVIYRWLANDDGTHLEGLGEHLADVLLAEVGRRAEERAALLALRGFLVFLLPRARCARARAHRAAEHLRAPPATDRALAVVQAEDRVGVGECPRVRALWKPRDDVERREGQRGPRGRSGRVGRRHGAC